MAEVADIQEPITRGVPYDGFWPHGGNSTPTRDAQSFMPIAQEYAKYFPAYQPGDRESTNVEDRRMDPVGIETEIHKADAKERLQGVGRFAQPELASVFQTRQSPAPGGASTAQEGPSLRSTTFDRNPFLPIGSYRGDKTVHWAVPGFVDDVWESMNRLKDGIPDVRDFDPKDTLNVAGSAMTGAAGRMLTQEAAGALGVGGGRLPKRFDVNEGISARQVYDDAARTEYRLTGPEGKKVGEVTLMEGSVPGTLSVENIVVNKDFRRQGVAESVYKQMTEAAGGEGKLIPSASLQEGSYALWQKMNPKLLEKGDYVKTRTPEGIVFERRDPTFTTSKARLNLDEFPKQGVMSFPFDPQAAPINSVRMEYQKRIRAKEDITLPPPKGVDPSIPPDFAFMNEAQIKQSKRLITTKAEATMTTLQKEVPDLKFKKLEQDGNSAYIQVMDGDKEILKFRVSDHGNTRQDSISIDPVTGNTVADLLEVLKYERGLTDVAPEIGWSLLPTGGLKKAMKREAGMSVFPEKRQIGGRAEYIRGGYQSNQKPYRIKDQTVGTDIQWRDPELLKPVGGAE